MEKLIELLNEYASEDFNWCVIEGKIYDKEMGYSEYDVPLNVEMGVYVISKQFGFIKWLVENEKIDLEKVERKFYNEICITDYGDRDRACGKSDLIISVLSIQDEPIEFLVSILK